MTIKSTDARPMTDEDARITVEISEALAGIAPSHRHEEARARFSKFNVSKDGLTVFSNPHYRPTKTMAERDARQAGEAEAHRRALELARASAPVVVVRCEPRRWWQW